MKLNYPLVLTWILDYILLTIFIVGAFYFVDEDLTMLKGMVLIQAAILWAIIHDHIYWLLLPNVIAKEKVDFRYNFQLVLCTIKLVLFFTAVVVFEIYNGAFYLNWKGIETLVLVYFEFNFMLQAKDNISLRFLHPWMHKQENYWIHVHHHESVGDCQTATTFHFDLLDVILENVSGEILIKVFYFLLGKPTSIHILSYFLLVWCDVMEHSMNPYVPVFFNPILDWYMKGNLVHNLHHVIGAAYYMSTPYNHIYDPESMYKDLDKYNKLLKTSISFELLLEDDVTQEAREIGKTYKEKRKKN